MTNLRLTVLRLDPATKRPWSPLRVRCPAWTPEEEATPSPQRYALHLAHCPHPTAHGPHSITLDPELAGRWWTDTPRCPIAVMPSTAEHTGLLWDEAGRTVWRPGTAGSVADLLVVDLDLDPAEGLDGITDWARLCTTHGQPAPTLTAHTPSGGRHLWFRRPANPDATHPLLRAAGLPNIPLHRIPGAPGVEIKSRRGYAAVPDGTDPRRRWDLATVADAWAPVPPWLPRIVATLRRDGQAPPPPHPAGTDRPAPAPAPDPDPGPADGRARSWSAQLRRWQGRARWWADVDSLGRATDGRRAELRRLAWAAGAAGHDRGEALAALEEAADRNGMRAKHGHSRTSDRIAEGYDDGAKAREASG